MARPRYRLRTLIRRNAPMWLVARGFAAKGRKDCRDHVFYNHDDVVERCYHCEPGERPYDPRRFGR